MSNKSVKGTRTEQNLLKSFAGEAQARNRYTYFAGVARKEGYRQIEAVFLETADQEKEHGKRFFKFLEGGDLEITAAFPAGVIGTTAENLKAAAAGEHCEADVLYPEFAKVADEEGFAEIATVYRNVSKAEIYWQCRNCGFVIKAKKAPVKCPACAHPQEFFEPMRHNY